MWCSFKSQKSYMVDYVFNFPTNSLLMYKIKELFKKTILLLLWNIVLSIFKAENICSIVVVETILEKYVHMHIQK